MSDPLASLDLGADEQVLWHGQPGVTLSRVDRQAVRSFAVAGVIVVLVLLNQAPWTFRAPFALVVGLLTGVGVALSRLVGGCHISIGWLLTAGPLFALFWAGTVTSRGLSGSLALLAHPVPATLMFTLLAAGLRVARALLTQLHTHYYVTSRRVAEVQAQGERSRIRWVTPLPKGFLQFRVVRPWGARGRGHIAVGTGVNRRLLRWLSQPEATLEDIKRSVGGFAAGPAEAPALATTSCARPASSARRADDPLP